LRVQRKKENIYDVGYMWPETMAKRGANEVVSWLHHYFQNKLFSGVKKINSEAKAIIKPQSSFSTLVKTGQFVAIEHNLPIRGHSFRHAIDTLQRLRK